MLNIILVQGCLDLISEGGGGERRGEGKVKKIGSIFKIHSKNCFRFNLSHVDNTQNSPVSLSASRLLA